MSSPTRPVTRILEAVSSGEEKATDELLPIVYDELRRLARAKLAHEGRAQTLQATALVHEAYLRLLGDDASESGSPHWENRRHFFAAAAEAMRRILIERARRAGRLKRGGDRDRITLQDDMLAAERGTPPIDLLALNESLNRLERLDGRKGEVVKLRYFAGLTLEDVSRALGVSLGTVKADWSLARAWLHRDLSRQAHG